MVTELAMQEIQIQIEAVRVVGRYRKDLGDIDDLAMSIADIGLINPIAVTPDMRLIAGQRRIEAHRRLGRDTIPARIVDNLDDATARLRAERDENTCRKEMTVSERVALAQALEALEAERIAQRQHEDRVRAGKIRQGKEEAPQRPDGRRGETARDVAGRAVDMPPTTYYKAKKVVEAAQDPTLPPAARAVAEAAAEDMDATGNIAGNYEKVRGARSTLTGQPKKTVMQTAAQQRRAIEAANSTLAGVCHALRQITELHDDITSEEAAQWVDGLSESRRTLDVLIKRLKERTNA